MEYAVSLPSRPYDSSHDDMERSAQMMLAGGKYLVIGPVQRIEGMGLVMDEGTKVISTGSSVRIQGWNHAIELTLTMTDLALQRLRDEAQEQQVHRNFAGDTDSAVGV